MSFPPNAYRDEDVWCTRTYATLRMFHDSADPHTVTERLGIYASTLRVEGELWEFVDEERRELRRPNRDTRWTLSSEGQVESRDSLRHIDWVLDYIERDAGTIAALIAEGWRLDMAVSWQSEVGDGGPRTTPLTMRRLADLGITLWYDVYFPYDKPTRIRRAMEDYNDGVAVAKLSPPDGG